MRMFVRHLWLCIRYAWRGSLSKANALATFGLGVVAAAAGMTGHSIAFSSDVRGAFVQGLAALGVAWFVIFLWRLVLAPSRLYVEAQARTRTLETQLAALNAAVVTSPLKIVFDPKNSSKRFWSLERWQITSRPRVFSTRHEYRVEVWNTSDKTVRNVRVVTEHTGMMPVRPTPMPFDQTKAELRDIHPYCSALAPVLHWPHPTIRAGMLAGPSALEYGPIRVTASGDDVPPASRIFNFDYQREPMIYD